MKEKKPFKITPKELNERLKWPLEDKKKLFIEKFIDFFIYFEGQVYEAFSGGKDSQMVDHIIEQVFSGKYKEYVERCIYCTVCDLPSEHKYYLRIKDVNYQSVIVDQIFGKPVKVFCDTGLEFPELRKHVKTFKDVIWLKPEMKFPDVIKNIGVAVGSKIIAAKIRRMKEYLLNPSEKNANTRRVWLTGINSKGERSPQSKLAKWTLKLLDAPFKTSDKCCDIFKKNPWDKYEKQTGRKGISGTTVEESMQRRSAYLYTGCNSMEKGRELCRPLSIFTESDVWMIAREDGVTFCEVYYDRELTVPDGEGGFLAIILPGEKRTGCIFCLFGIHLESKKQLNRFQRLALTHPKQYVFMVNVCGLGIVLEYIGVEFKVTKELLTPLIKKST